MIQLKIGKYMNKEIPYHIVFPLQSNGEAIIFYHGWSSSGEKQMTRAAWLALHGYTVYLPEAIYHGTRNPLADYFSVSVYSLFWETIFQNMKEFSLFLDLLHHDGYDKPIIMGHSMGGFSALGIGSAYGKQVKAIVSMNGSGDWLLSHLFMQARFAVDAGPHWPFYEKIANASPMKHIKELAKMPILLLNGESDITVDSRAQAHFYDTLRKESNQVYQVTYPRLGHFVTTNMMDQAVEWLENIK